MAQVITPDQVTKLLDKLAVALQHTWNGLGDGSEIREATFGASLIASQVKGILEGSDDNTFAVAELQAQVNQSALTIVRSVSALSTFVSGWSRVMAAINQACAQSISVDSSIVGLESYLSWYNVGNGSSYWQALAPPEWRTIHYAAFRSYPDPNNVYFPVVENGEVIAEDEDGLFNIQTFADALYRVSRATSVDTPTAGFIIDPTKFAGGRCFAQWTGGAGSGASSITVEGLDQNGDAETWELSGTWGAGDFTATQNGAAMTPVNNPHSLITKVTGVVTTGVTDYELLIEARPPLNRTYGYVL